MILFVKPWILLYCWKFWTYSESSCSPIIVNMLENFKVWRATEASDHKGSTWGGGAGEEGGCGGGWRGQYREASCHMAAAITDPSPPWHSAAPGACLEGGDLLSYTIYPNTCSPYQPNHNMSGPCLKAFSLILSNSLNESLAKTPQHVLTIPTKPQIHKPRPVPSWTLS